MQKVSDGQKIRIVVAGALMVFGGAHAWGIGGGIFAAGLWLVTGVINHTLMTKSD